MSEQRKAGPPVPGHAQIALHLVELERGHDLEGVALAVELLGLQRLVHAAERHHAGDARSVWKKSAAIAPPGVRIFRPSKSPAALIGRLLVVMWWKPFCSEWRNAKRPARANSPRITPPSAPLSAANTDRLS